MSKEEGGDLHLFMFAGFGRILIQILEEESAEELAPCLKAALSHMHARVARVIPFLTLWLLVVSAVYTSICFRH